MSKAEKIFWGLLIILAGAVLGMIAASFTVSPSKKNCDNGISYQVENGVHKKTYIPANDTCKEDK